MANIHDIVVPSGTQALLVTDLISKLYHCFSMAKVVFEDEQGNFWAITNVRHVDGQAAVLSGKLIHSEAA